MTPNATSLIATFQLKEFADNVARCSNFCGQSNINSSHLVILGLTCECYADLNTFHCEEEVGEPLANVYCIEKRPRPETTDDKVEPVLSWREPLDRLPKSSIFEMESLSEVDIFATTFSDAANSTHGSDDHDDDGGDIFTTSTTTIETSAILVGVLLVAAVLLLAGFGVKTCIEVKRQKVSAIRKRLQQSHETFTSVSLS